MTETEVLCWCFKYFYSMDNANAVMHCAPVRYSPITFRLAETLHNREDVTDALLENIGVRSVMLDRGVYAEDTGR